MVAMIVILQALASAPEPPAVHDDAQVRTEQHEEPTAASPLEALGQGMFRWRDGEERARVVLGVNAAGVPFGFYVAELEISPSPLFSLYLAGGASTFRGGLLFGEYEG